MAETPEIDSDQLTARLQLAADLSRDLADDLLDAMERAQSGFAAIRVLLTQENAADDDAT